MNATATTQATVMGMRNFQPKCMNWSYRTRGRVPRSQTKKNMKSHSFVVNPAAPTSRPGDVVVDEGDDWRSLPAAEEHRRGQGRDGEHVDVLGEENIAKRIDPYSVWEATDDLTLALGEVERSRFVSPTIVTR